MTHTMIVEKLIGPIIPIGESEADSERLESLHSTMTLIDNLIVQVNVVAGLSECQQYSLKIAGKTAEKFLIGLKDRL